MTCGIDAHRSSRHPKPLKEASTSWTLSGLVTMLYEMSQLGSGALMNEVSVTSL